MVSEHIVSLLQKLRQEYQPLIPYILKDINSLSKVFSDQKKEIVPQVNESFPYLTKSPSHIHFKLTTSVEHVPLKVGVVFSGGQAPGGHNVISGLYDALKKMHPKSQVLGFLNGPKGVLENKTVLIEDELLNFYRNQGGFNLLGSGREKIETDEQFQKAEKTVRELKLDGLIIIGGDDSNTNAAHLSEYFFQKNCPTIVVGVPKTIDGDLRSEEIEISFGFDTATKVYAEAIGNLCLDALSGKKMYFFVKLMGRNASHVTLECALKTQVNLSLIGEEIDKDKISLEAIVKEIANLVEERSKTNKHYGVILFPEGIIEFIPEFRKLIDELNHILIKDFKDESEKIEFILKALTDDSKQIFSFLPSSIQKQLIKDRDAHGNVQVSKIETERLFIELVQKELKERKYPEKFNAQPYFLGYEGRCALPSNFDANYCYCLGMTAALLVSSKANGFIAFVQNLNKSVEDWKIGGINLATLLNSEKRLGKEKLVIAKALVNLDSAIFKTFKNKRKEWRLSDSYLSPGPIQFFGPKQLTDSIPLIL